MSDLLIGGRRPAAIFVGRQPVSAVYLGRTLVWQAGIYVYFDAGAVDGIEWQANALTRTGNTSYCTASINPTYMRIYTSSVSTSYAHNAHVITAAAAKIPRGVTKLCAMVYCDSGGYGFTDSSSVRIGLVPVSAASTSSMITIASGTCSSTSYDSVAEAKTISGDVSAYAGSNDYRIIVYGIQVPRSGGARGFRVHKIWFE